MEKNSYTVEEAANKMGCTLQAVREQIKAGKIAGCTCIRKGKNWTYYIPKLALDNYLKGANALDIETIKEAVKIAFKEVIEEMTEKEIERRLAQ
ncbi:helix-turn-helix domain-containing protein [Fusobacterium sp.]|jgi:hypothetical protein|uniref:helix-turn-helix domain-containing protein n=1 Tax=Fusobacterium sp. TaxID=68766 RepID=UPI002A806D3A|nr:helix-turn-helix domain-containing protein [Fusobacterium sp.]